MSIPYKLVSKLNDYATENSVSVDEKGNPPKGKFIWKPYEETYPILKTLRHQIAPKLAELGIYFFIVGNRSGWGDAPSDEIGNAFDKYSDEVDFHGETNYLDLPVIIGYINVDPKTNKLERDNVVFNFHTGIATNPKLKKEFLQIMYKELGKEIFQWDGTENKAMIVKLN